MSEYNIFVRDYMPIVRDQNPGIRQTEVMRIVKSMWQERKGTSLPRRGPSPKRNSPGRRSPSRRSPKRSPNRR